MIRVCLRFLIALQLILLVSASALAAEPLSLAKVETLLKGRVDCERIVRLIKVRKVNIDLANDIEEKLRRLGANQAVISAIRTCTIIKTNNKNTVIRIESEPTGADVFVDEKFRGITPLKLSNIPAGKHRLTLEKVGVYEDYVTEFELKHGQTMKKTVVLVKKPPASSDPPPVGQQMVEVRVMTEPVKVSIYLDDKYIAESPANFLALVGNHHLRLVPKLSTIFETVEKEISIRSNALNVVYLKLNSKSDY